MKQLTLGEFRELTKNLNDNLIIKISLEDLTVENLFYRVFSQEFYEMVIDDKSRLEIMLLFSGESNNNETRRNSTTYRRTGERIMAYNRPEWINRAPAQYQDILEKHDILLKYIEGRENKWIYIPSRMCVCLRNYRKIREIW